LNRKPGKKIPRPFLTEDEAEGEEEEIIEVGEDGAEEGVGVESVGQPFWVLPASSFS
jgi:hypothetical protein